MVMTIVLGLAWSAATAAEPADCLLVPPTLENRLVFYRSFDAPDGAAEVNAGIEVVREPALLPAGYIGRGASTSQEHSLLLVGPALSPHEPLTVALWWALEQTCPEQSGFGLLHLYGPKGFVSAFARGGPWCALDDTAAVLQVWDVPGIPGINDIYDRRVRHSLDLSAGAWHHLTLTVAAGQEVRLFVDGRRATTAHLTSRGFGADHDLTRLNLGAAYGPTVFVDELMIWRRTLTDAEIADLVTAAAQLRRSGHIVR